MLKDHITAVKNKDIDLIDYTLKALKEAKKIDKEYHYFNVLSEELALQLAENVSKKRTGKLAGVLVSVKDCLCVKDIESRAGSKILSGYKPVFHATSVQRVIDEGGIIIGKTSQDAFGFGGFNLNVGLGFDIPKNPVDPLRVCGGSSGGSAGITKKLDLAHLSLVESTGGSIADPACFCGVFGFTPTYGLVSRHGLIDYANSLDKIGVMGRNSEDVQLGLDVISGPDPNDLTCTQEKRSKDGKIKTIGVIKESLDVDPKIREKFLSSVDKLGIKTLEVSLPFVQKYSLASYYTIALAEASTNLARYCGMRYGAEETVTGDYNTYFTRIRSKNLSPEEKRRIIIGTFVRQAGYRDAYYLKAQKVRTKIIEEYQQALKKVDVLLSPTMPTIAPKIADANKLTPLQSFMMDLLTVGPNLAGLPHYNIPIGTIQGMPTGMMAISGHLQEEKLFSLAGVALP